jgi:hypothetical protein
MNRQKAFATPLIACLPFPQPMKLHPLVIGVRNTLLVWRRIWARQDRAAAREQLRRLHATVQAHAAPELIQLPDAPRVVMPRNPPPIRVQPRG